MLHDQDPALPPAASGVPLAADEDQAPSPPELPAYATDPSHWAWAPALAPYPPREGQDVAARGYAPPGYATPGYAPPGYGAVVGSSTSPNTADPIDLQPRQWSPRQTLAAVLAALAISAAVSVGVAFADTGSTAGQNTPGTGRFGGPGGGFGPGPGGFGAGQGSQGFGPQNGGAQNGTLPSAVPGAGAGSVPSGTGQTGG